MSSRSLFVKAGTVLGALGAASVLGLNFAPQQVSAAAAGDSSTPPAVIHLTGVVRDFRERTHPQGHPDFERTPTGGFAHYVRNIATTIGADFKPVYSGGGRKLTRQFKNAQNKPICYTMYDPALGDVVGTYGAVDSGGVQSSSSFNQWYNDVPGVNLSTALTIDLVRQHDGSYMFDDTLNPTYSSLGGFFPIEGQLFGNPGGSPNRNFHFTYELHGMFTYDSHGSQIFKFVGDDDVWVFINGQLVIDIGGVHTAVEQNVDLNRLHLVDGQEYRLDFFYAERHRTQANCRIVTNLQLETIGIPSVNANYD